MQNNRNKRTGSMLLVVAACGVLVTACEKEYFSKPPAPPPPKTAKETTVLEASFVKTSPMSLTDSYWKSADFLRVAAADLNKGVTYSDGFLNMTGTYNGVGSFNGGSDAGILMKAAYDEKKLYIYVEWSDNTISPMFAASMFDGPQDPLKQDSATRWTSQGSSDKIALAFDIDGATGAAGTFASTGCAASCHGGSKQTTGGAVDIWRWDVGASDALGYAADMHVNSSGLAKDAGDAMFAENKSATGDARSAPAFEWDGTEQSVTRPDGKLATLDPGYYLLNKTSFAGDASKGKNIFHDAATADCKHCHGEGGRNGEATEFTNPAFQRKFSRKSLKEFAAGENHEGSSYWARVPIGSVEDLIAYIKGLGSVPGVYLTPPSGSHADVWSVSNVTRARINAATTHGRYSVLLIRDLSTPYPDDVQFATPGGKSFTFGIALMDADRKNHIGSLKQTLTFKPKS